MSKYDQKTCLYGAGGHGRVVAAQMRAAGYSALSFADKNRTIGELVDGVPTTYSDISDIPRDVNVIASIGDNKARKIAFENRRDASGATTYFMCPHATHHSEISIGDGSMILSGAVLNPGSRIGAGVIVNSSAVIEHDCQIGNYCHISPNATLAGGVTLHEGVWVGAGAVVIQGLSIAPWTIIGAGAVVTRDIKDTGTYIGAPARLISKDIQA
ncbi:MAG: acetyltransferase [Halocynthiibacter sp.]